ncbi:hypothetical protein BJ508DRAFT_322576 [Ascobolus immersus RN42]|uniref:Uncharacterized protein n=1 Tax=Ascobolus immersus RN42 TaxID=1160509 RepID=A0A3N4IIS5_ASCIM|nr:hypothetical protein BJ508DRAFT_322576 [Ascobolus immersus RN42]
MPRRLKLLHRHHNRRTPSTESAKSEAKGTNGTTERPAADSSSTAASLPTLQFGTPIGSSSTLVSSTPPTALLDSRPKALSKPSLSEPLVTDIHHGLTTSSTTSLHLAASPVTPINTHSSDQNTPSPKGRVPPPRSNTLPLPLAAIPKTNSSSSLYSSFQKEMAASATATKLNAKKFLNPMALLGRRKSTQYDDGGSHSSKKDKSKKSKDYEEPSYNPHIIYATRHPDWSSPSKRTSTVDDTLANPPRLSLQTTCDTTTPIPIPKNVEKTPVFKECFDDADIPSKKTLEAERLEGIHTGLEALTLGGTGKSQQFDKSLEIPKFGEKKTVKDSTQQDSDSLAAYEKQLREGVTLQDKGKSLPKRLLSNASRFSFEVSSIADSSHENLNETSEKVDQDGTSDSFEVISKTENNETAENGSGAVGLNRRKLSSKRKVVRNRWSNSDFSDLEEEMANGTYDIDDDDMYFADDNILETFADYSEDAPAVRGLGDEPIEEEVEEEDVPSTMIDSESEGQTTPLPMLSNTAQEPATAAVGMLGNTKFDNTSHFSLLTHPHNREEGGTHTPDNGPAMPPFLNPIGAGLPQDGEAQFYALDGTRCDQRGQPLSLSALTYSLTQYQLQQKAKEESGFDSAYEDEPTSFQFDDYDDDDDPIIAAANAEALASDQDNYYGSEFNFYATSSGSSSTEYVAGGYFAPSQVWPGKPGLGIFRQPSLTPISERSECSYRNSMVGTLSPNMGLSPNLSFFPTSPSFHPGHSVQGVGGTPDQEMSLSQLLKFHNDQLQQRPQSPQSIHSIAPQPLPHSSTPQQPQNFQSHQQLSSPYHHSNYPISDLAMGVAGAYDYNGNEDLDDYEAEWDDDGFDLEQVTSYDAEWEEERQRTKVSAIGAGLGLGLQLGNVPVGQEVAVKHE